jgi:hypothetical protein
MGNAWRVGIAWRFWLASPQPQRIGIIGRTYNLDSNWKQQRPYFLVKPCVVHGDIILTLALGTMYMLCNNGSCCCGHVRRRRNSARTVCPRNYNLLLRVTSKLTSDMLHVCKGLASFNNRNYARLMRSVSKMAEHVGLHNCNLPIFMSRIWTSCGFFTHSAFHKRSVSISRRAEDFLQLA